MKYNPLESGGFQPKHWVAAPSEKCYKSNKLNQKELTDRPKSKSKKSKSISNLIWVLILCNPHILLN